MPWKNGRGSTTEIAIAPDGADATNFDWRISMAAVETAGPFSIFPEVERSLCVITGDGLLLDGLEPDPVVLTQASAPYGFAADVPVACRLLGGAVTDLNVMTRRDRFRHQVERLGDCAIEAPLAFLVALSATRAVVDGVPFSLSPKDALLIDGGRRARLTDPSSMAYIVLIEPVAHGSES